jgi:hypothetical protein
MLLFIWSQKEERKCHVGPCQKKLEVRPPSSLFLGPPLSWAIKNEDTHSVSWNLFEICQILDVSRCYLVSKYIQI